MTYRAIFGLLIGAALFILLATLTVGLATSGNEVGCIGNGVVYASPTRDQLAALLVSTRSAPDVSDATLRAIHEAISRKASAGDLDAALVVLQVAALQRKSP